MPVVQGTYGTVETAVSGSGLVVPIVDTPSGERKCGQRMRVVVYPHELAIGGSQINAIDLGAVMRDRAIAWIYGQDGPLATTCPRRRASPTCGPRTALPAGPDRIAQLARFAHRERIDIIPA